MRKIVFNRFSYMLCMMMAFIAISCTNKDDVTHFPFFDNYTGNWNIKDVRTGEVYETEFVNCPSVAINNNFLVRSTNGLYDAYRIKNHELIKLGEGYISATLFSDGKSVVKKDNEPFTFIDSDGNTSPILNELGGKPVKKIGRFINGFAPICVAGKWGVINKDCEQVIEPEFDNLEIVGNEIYKVSLNGEEGFIDYKGKAISSVDTLASSLIDSIYLCSDVRGISSFFLRADNFAIAAPPSISIELDGNNIKMIRVLPGSFTMDEDLGWKDPYGFSRIEYQPHKETIADIFYLAETELTRGQWKALISEDAVSHWEISRQGDNYPVDSENYERYLDFCAKLSSKTGYKFRLPTNEEWEFAARGGNMSKGYYFSGGNNPTEVAWYIRNSINYSAPVPEYQLMSLATIQEVRQKKANELGFYDMSGNVSEVVESIAEKSTGFLFADDSFERHTVRGGSCFSDEQSLIVTQVESSFLGSGVRIAMDY